MKKEIIQIRQLAAQYMTDSIDYSRTDRVWNYGEHWHDYYEWIFYRNCRVICTLNGKEFELGDGSCVLLSPYDFHSTRVLESNENTYHIRIAVLAEVMQGKLAHNGYYMEKTSAFLERALECFAIAEEREREYLFHAMVSHMEKYAQPLLYYDSEKDSTLLLIQKALEYLHIHSVTTLSETAEYCNISPHYLSGILKQYCGSSYIEIYTMLRMNRAKKLLCDTEQNVSEIAWECGYNNLSQFLRVFKRMNGCTPKEFRARERKGKTE